MSAFSILCVVGARPNFMKMAPIMAALSALRPQVEVKLVHTGQHYDVAMNHQYFEALGIPAPDINLEVGSGSHAQQTAEVMKKFEPALDEVQPTAVLVVGDVNSTIACALVAAKKGVPVIHVEAGLRSFDRAMPEEINRVRRCGGPTASRGGDCWAGRPSLPGAPRSPRPPRRSGRTA